MKKFIKSASLAALCFLITLTSITAAFAATVFEENGFTIKVEDDGYTKLSDWSGEGVMRIPSVILNHYVSEIENFAFLNRTDITGLNLEDVLTLKKIGSYAFAGSGLTGELVIPNRVTEISNSAFQETQISSIVLYSGAKTIPEQMCYTCSNLSEVTINYGFQSIGRLAFARCGNLKNVYISPTVTEIGSYAFAFCPSLEYLEIPYTVTNISNNAFNNDDNLVLGVYKDSYALQYAEENEIDHIILDGDKTGDVNGDGVVDILDATEIQKYAAESTDFTPEQFELGDINKDGYCDVIDALLVQKSVIGAYEIPPIVVIY